jgi:hypothetical protein
MEKGLKGFTGLGIVANLGSSFCVFEFVVSLARMSGVWKYIGLGYGF